LAVGLGDGSAYSAALGRNFGVGFGGKAVERQDARLEILIDHRVDSQLQPMTTLAVGKDRDASAQFRLGDRRDEQIACVMVAEPVQHDLGRFRAHQF
jgi:hypothetical protein